MNSPGGMTPGAVGRKIRTALSIQNGFGHDGSSGIAPAEEKNVIEHGCILFWLLAQAGSHYFSLTMSFKPSLFTGRSLFANLNNFLRFQRFVSSATLGIEKAQNFLKGLG